MVTSTLSGTRRDRVADFEILAREHGPGALPQTWSVQRLFGLTIALSLAVRLVVLMVAGHAPLSSDAQDYREMAQFLASGKPFVPYWPPGLPLFLLPFVRLGASMEALRGAMLIYWLLLCWGVYRIARMTNTLRVACFLFLMSSFAPAAIQFSIEPLTQMPAAALLLLAVSASLACLLETPTWPEYALQGVSLGLLALTRPSTLPLMLLLPAIVYFKARRWLKPLLSLALAGAIVFGWMIKAHQLSGTWLLNTSNSVNLFEGNNRSTPIYRTWFFGSRAKPGTPGIEAFPQYEHTREETALLPKVKQAAVYDRLAFQYIADRPDLFVLRTMNRIRCFWSFDTFTAAGFRHAGAQGRRWFPLVFGLDAALYTFVAGLSLFWIAAAPLSFWKRVEVRLVTATLLVYALPYLFSMSHPTYHYPVLMLLALLGACARRALQAGSPNWRQAWASLSVFALIQVEWLWVLARSS